MPVPQLLSVSVVIPLASVNRLPLLFAGLPPVGEIIVVVGPGEDTVLPLPRAARVIRQTRHGVGNALACGVAAATGDVVVTLPGDGFCDPADLPRLVEALGTAADLPFLSPTTPPRAPPSGPASPTTRRPTADRAFGAGAGIDVAEGVRATRRSDLIMLWFMSVLLGCRPSGPGTGFRAFRRDRAHLLGLPRATGADPARGDGRDVEPLLATRSRAAGLRVAEVPVTYYPQIGGTALLRALATLTAIIRERLARRRGAPSHGAESIVVLTGGPSRNTPSAPSRQTSGAPSRQTSGGPSRHTPGDPSRHTPGGPSRQTPGGVPRQAAGGAPGHTPSSPSRPTLADLSRLTPGDPPRPVPAPIFVGPMNAPRKPGADRHPTDPGLRRWPAPNRVTAAGTDHPNSTGIGMTDRRRGTERRGPERRRTDTTPDRRATAGRPGNDRPNTDSPHRRRWRDGQTDTNIGRRPDLRVINGEGSGPGGPRGHLRSV
jgi:hypothetical protein